MDTGECMHPGSLLKRCLWRWSVKAQHVETCERVLRVNTEYTRQSTAKDVMGKNDISFPVCSTQAANVHVDIMGKHCLWMKGAAFTQRPNFSFGFFQEVLDPEDWLSSLLFKSVKFSLLTASPIHLEASFLLSC